MLPQGFEFSQGSLQDYVDCPRRFQLKYVTRQPWPAVEIEPALERERFAEQGRHFHRLVERYFAGIPEAAIGSAIEDPTVQVWWRNFMQDPPINLPQEVRLAEVRLATPLAGQRLVAVFDLLAIEPERRMVIVDWKTTRKRPKREVLQQRMQTRLYPFLAVEAATHLFSGPVDPARVSMLYWFAEDPANSHVFLYDMAKYEQDREFIVSLLKQIQARQDAVQWELVADDSTCRYCGYRSLCDRGICAGVGGEANEVGLDDDVWFEFEDVEEIAY